jgi:hypothetical protein
VVALDPVGPLGPPGNYGARVLAAVLGAGDLARIKRGGQRDHGGFLAALASILTGVRGGCTPNPTDESPAIAWTIVTPTFRRPLLSRECTRGKRSLSTWHQPSGAAADAREAPRRGGCSTVNVTHGALQTVWSLRSTERSCCRVPQHEQISRASQKKQRSPGAGPSPREVAGHSMCSPVSRGSAVIVGCVVQTYTPSVAQESKTASESVRSGTVRVPSWHLILAREAIFRLPP